MAEKYVWFITAEQADKRLDSVLAEEMDISRSSAQQWLEQGLVTALGKTLSKKDKLKEGIEVMVDVPDPVAYDIVAEDIPLDIIYEDEHLLVVNKPKGMVVHPAAGHYSGTLVNALLHHCGDLFLPSALRLWKQAATKNDDGARFDLKNLPIRERILSSRLLPILHK